MEQIEQTPTPNAPAPRKNKKKLIKWILIGLAGILVLTALALIISNAVELNSSYNRAIEFLSQEQFDQAESAAKEIRSRELREKYYAQRNKAASQKALELLEDGNIEQAFRLADIISDPLILREFNNKFIRPYMSRRLQYLIRASKRAHANLWKNTHPKATNTCANSISMREANNLTGC